MFSLVIWTWSYPAVRSILLKILDSDSIKNILDDNKVVLVLDCNCVEGLIVDKNLKAPVFLGEK